MADAPHTKEASGNLEEIEAVTRQRQEMAASDIEDDPHRAALENNPEEAERLTWATGMSVFVSEHNANLEW